MYYTIVLEMPKPKPKATPKAPEKTSVCDQFTCEFK